MIADQTRVALGDHIGARMGVRTLILVIGEQTSKTSSPPRGLSLRPSQRRLSYAVVDGGDVMRVWAFRLIRTSNASETCHSRDNITGVPSPS